MPHLEDDEGDVRLDTGVREGDEVSVFYDPMIAKLVVWGDDRAEAARRMQSALAQTPILGVKTNLAFLERVVRHPAFLAGDTDTAFIERHRADLLPPEARGAARGAGGRRRARLPGRAARHRADARLALERHRRLAPQPAGAAAHGVPAASDGEVSVHSSTR